MQTILATRDKVDSLQVWQSVKAFRYVFQLPSRWRLEVGGSYSESSLASSWLVLEPLATSNSSPPCLYLGIVTNVLLWFIHRRLPHL